MYLVYLETTRLSTSPAFVAEASTAGAKFNVYIAGADGIFTSVLSGVTAGLRDSSLEGLQTFGGVRALARYVKIEGVPGIGGEFSISEVCSVGIVTADEHLSPNILGLRIVAYVALANALLAHDR